MSTRLCVLGLLGLALVSATGCGEMDALTQTATSEGKALLDRLNRAVNAPPEGAPVGLLATPAGTEVARGVPGPAGEGQAASGARTAAPSPGATAPSTASDPGRGRFLAAYALIRCAQARTDDELERERRRAEILGLLAYDPGAWRADLQRHAGPELEALVALCR